jgi:biopolymer transport protein ExbD
MSGLREQRYRRPELPLVPLIDVLVMLVLFAFVTMRFNSSRTLNITVPKVETAGVNQFTGRIEIGVDRDGIVTVNGQLVDDANLEALLREVRDVNRDTPVLMRADETTQFGKVTQIWDLCRRLGLNNIRMQARQ